MWYRIGADLVLAAHLLFIGFVAGGAFLAWRWPRIIWAHPPAMAYGALVEVRRFHLPADVAAESPAAPRRGQRIPGRLHLPLPDPGHLPARPDPGNPDRAGLFVCSSPPSDTAVTCTGTARSRLGGPVTDHPCPADAPTAVMGIMLGSSGASTIPKVAERTGQHWAREIVAKVPASTLKQINNVLGRNFITKYGTKQGIIVLGQVMPFGIGAAIGGGANALLGWSAIRAARRAFGEAPATWPEGLQPATPASVRSSDRLPKEYAGLGGTAPRASAKSVG
jgi:hypothetical protein